MGPQLEPHERVGAIRLDIHEGAHGHQLGPRHVVQRQIVLSRGGGAEIRDKRVNTLSVRGLRKKYSVRENRGHSNTEGKQE